MINEVSIFFYGLLFFVYVFSDIGGYVFGKIFWWKKLTKISPKKTISGVLGSFYFSSDFIILLHEIFKLHKYSILILSK